MLLILVLQGDPDSLSDNLVPAVQAAARLPNGAVMLAAYVASLTITEELFWRGFLQTLLLQMVARNRARQALVLGIIALAWTGAHTIVEGYGVQASAAVFIIGIALGVFAQRFGVAVTTATHVLFNLLVLWANTRH
jgi:membrane protease YdiL (CAAX protease family)